MKHDREMFEIWMKENPKEARKIYPEEFKKYTCCLCKKKCKGFGNNPYPLKKDTDKKPNRCCDDCNLTKVIPARLKLAGIGDRK